MSTKRINHRNKKRRLYPTDIARGAPRKRQKSVIDETKELKREAKEEKSLNETYRELMDEYNSLGSKIKNFQKELIKNQYNQRANDQIRSKYEESERHNQRIKKQLMEKINKLTAQNTEQQKLMKLYKKQRDEFKLISISLRDQILNGTNPRIGLYESVKSRLHGNEWTRDVKRLYNEVSDGCTGIMVSQHHEKLNQAIISSTEEFIKANQEHPNYQDPLIKIKNDTHQMSDVVKKERIKSGHTVESLHWLGVLECLISQMWMQSTENIYFHLTLTKEQMPNREKLQLIPCMVI